MFLIHSSYKNEDIERSAAHEHIIIDILSRQYSVFDRL